MDASRRRNKFRVLTAPGGRMGARHAILSEGFFGIVFQDCLSECSFRMFFQDFPSGSPAGK